MYHLIIAQNSLYKNTHGAHYMRTKCIYHLAFFNKSPKENAIRKFTD